MPVGTKDVPTIEVFTTDIGAEKIITNASSVTGITSVEVKSRDGSESQIYSIKFNQGECLNVISCENTTFLNEQSEPIVNLIGLKKVVGQLSFDNNTGENVDFTSIIVIYDSNNKLKKTKIIPVSIQKYQTASLQETLELPDDSGNYHIKIYLWDTLNNNRPLGIPFDFPG